MLLFKIRPYSTSNIGFVGLGNMGSRMATTLFTKSSAINLFLYDFNALTTKEVQLSLPSHNNSKAIACESLKDLSNACSTVITMLPNSETVDTVYRDNILPVIAKGSLLIDSSTISPDTAARLATEASTRSLTFLDAPVSGGINGAASGTLTFMLGGPVEAVRAAQPLLDKIGAKQIHCGEQVGSGQVAKLCNNLLLAISMAGVCEAMRIAAARGMDLKLLTNIINASSGRCWASDSYNPVPGVMPTVPASNEHRGGFGVALMHKDVSYALQMAKQANLPLPLTTAVEELYARLASDNTLASKDFSVYFKTLCDPHVNQS